MVIQAQLADAQQIVDLINSDSKHLLRRTREEVEAQISNFVVIKDKNKVVACGAFEEYAPKIAEIRSVIVDKHYRSKGCGDMIVSELLKRAKPRQEVFVVTSSVKFFNKMGFQDCLNEKRILFYQK
jgi:N-acetylglutamate synthase-like GNAT family acetyltransferase